MKHMVFLISLFISLPAFAADTYKIDEAHTAVIFKINHLGFSHVYGQFPGVEGSFTIDEAKPDASSLEVILEVEKLTTQNGKRDAHLKGPDFFNSKQFPKITFKSKSIKKSGNNYTIAGDLSLHGVTKPLTVTFKRARTGQDPWKNTRTGGDTSFKIKRSDFGMSFMQGENQVGDEVEIIISLEGIKQ